MTRVDRLRHQWLAQPHSDRPEASLEWRSKGLVALFDCKAGVELVSGARASVDAVPRAASTSGTGADFSSQAQRYAHRLSYAVTGPITIVVLCDVDALTNFGGIIAKQASSTARTPYEIRLGGGATDSNLVFGRASNGQHYFLSTGANQVTAGQRAVRLVFTDTAGTQTAGTRNVWVNGIKVAQSTLVAGAADGSAISDDGVSDVWIGQRFDGATQLDGRIFYIGLVAGVLADADIVALNANPWALYEDQWAEVPRGLSGAHATSGGLTAGSATIAGTATHLTLHATSGGLTAGAATIAGTATHPHIASGGLTAGSATIAGTATHPHTTSGGLTADAATIAGTAAHSVPAGSHDAAGGPAGSAATIAGTAAHLTLHATSGALVADAATISGAAAHLTLHDASGGLVASAASISGAAFPGTAPPTQDVIGHGAAELLRAAEEMDDEEVLAAFIPIAHRSTC
jgi:hypothetical protein